MKNEALWAALSRVPAEPLIRPSAAQRVGAVLRDQIIDGHLRPGTRLTEETISAALGFSRNTIRESFVLLAAQRLVVREAHRGVFVATPGPDDVRDIYATRRLVEPPALEWGSQLTPARIASMREIVDAGVVACEAADREAVALANQLFHREVAAASGSRRLALLMEDVLAEMRLVFHAMAADPTFHHAFARENEAIVSQLEAGDRAGAAQRLWSYLQTAETELLSVVAPQGQPKG